MNTFEIFELIIGSGLGAAVLLVGGAILHKWNREYLAAEEARQGDKRDEE